MAKKKTKLCIEPFDDIRIIGINTGMPDYKLAWNLNKELNINLVKYKDISPNKVDSFSFYFYDAGENSNAYNLVALSNKDKKWVFFVPQTDFLFIIRNYIGETDFQQLLNKVKIIPDIHHSYIIDLEKNKKIDVILESIEFHEKDIVAQQNQRYKFVGNVDKNKINKFL